jgi:hypothetical protein
VYQLPFQAPGQHVPICWSFRTHLTLHRSHLPLNCLPFLSSHSPLAACLFMRMPKLEMWNSSSFSNLVQIPCLLLRLCGHLRLNLFSYSMPCT